MERQEAAFDRGHVDCVVNQDLRRDETGKCGPAVADLAGVRLPLTERLHRGSVPTVALQSATSTREPDGQPSQDRDQRDQCEERPEAAACCTGDNVPRGDRHGAGEDDCQQDEGDQTDGEIPEDDRLRRQPAPAIEIEGCCHRAELAQGQDRRTEDVERADADGVGQRQLEAHQAEETLDEEAVADVLQRLDEDGEQDPPVAQEVAEGVEVGGVVHRGEQDVDGATEQRHQQGVLDQFPSAGAPKCRTEPRRAQVASVSAPATGA